MPSYSLPLHLLCVQTNGPLRAALITAVRQAGQHRFATFDALHAFCTCSGTSHGGWRTIGTAVIVLYRTCVEKVLGSEVSDALC
jgi:hypothetical protein